MPPICPLYTSNYCFVYNKEHFNDIPNISEVPLILPINRTQERIIIDDYFSNNNIIRFGLGGSVAEVFARALGFFAALTYLKILPVRVVFVEGNNATVAVARPNISDGDYLYLLKLKKDNYELPDKAHFGQLHYYLCEKKRKGIIKDVLPCGENINRVISRLCGQSLVYESLTEIPEDCFGVIVSVARGESVNGVKLGCFKDNL